MGVGPALEDPAYGRQLGESVFTRERHAFVAVGVGGGDVSGEDRGPAGQRKGMGKGVGMSQLPAVCERAIGSSGGLIRIAAMPKRPGQLHKGGDPDVLPVLKGGIAMLVGPIILTQSEMGWIEPGQRCSLSGRRTAYCGRMAGVQLLPKLANTVVRRLVNEHMPILIKPEQRRFRIVADRLKRVIDRGETIDEPISVAEPRVTQDIGDADRIKRCRALTVWRFARQLEENLRQQ